MGRRATAAMRARFWRVPNPVHLVVIVMAIALATPLCLALAQSTGVPRLVRAPDGTLYVVYGGQKAAIEAAAITDEELAALPDASPLADGAIPLAAFNAPSPAGARGSPGWAPVAAFSGTTRGQTDVFIIGGEQWRVTWTVAGPPSPLSGSVGGLFAWARRPDDPTGRAGQQQVAVSVSTPNGVANLTGSGQWFIAVERADGPWRLEVEELR